MRPERQNVCNMLIRSDDHDAALRSVYAAQVEYVLAVPRIGNSGDSGRKSQRSRIPEGPGDLPAADHPVSADRNVHSEFDVRLRRTQ